jgi:hypothetical protein
MKKLIKTLEVADCEIFAVKNHQRFFIGKATPTIEIYQHDTTPIKTYDFSLICPKFEFDSGIGCDSLDGLFCFDMKMLIKRKDNVFIPFEFYGLTNFSIGTSDEWVFKVSNYELTHKIKAF